LIDHGKTTLSNRLLELTGLYLNLISGINMCFLLPGTSSRSTPTLDNLQVEQERGITVKAHTTSMFYKHEGVTYMLNLIDTPVSISLPKLKIFDIFFYNYRVM
jgi:translation elongation factor EF-4